jgi:hypothetical protein
MMAYTLSKLNMLILVTALFAIIAFFMQALTGLVVGISAEELVSGYIESISSLVLSDSLCFTSSATVPDYITYFGGATQRERLFTYIVKMSSLEPPGGVGVSSLIMSVANRQFPDRFLAAKRIDVKANIKVYDWEIDETGIDVLHHSDETIIDPQAFPPINSFVLVKEVYRDTPYLHVIPCATEGRTGLSTSVCEYNKRRVGCCLQNERGSPSACLPTLDNCAGVSCA